VCPSLSRRARLRQPRRQRSLNGCNMWQRAREHAELPTSSSAADPGGKEHKDHTRNIQGAHGADMEHTTNKEHKERRTGSTRNIQGAHGAHGADMENIRSILLTRNTRNAARSIHKDGVRRGFETNADCYSMTRGNLEIKILAPGGEGWGPAFPFVSLYGCTRYEIFTGYATTLSTRVQPYPLHARCTSIAYKRVLEYT